MKKVGFKFDENSLAERKRKEVIEEVRQLAKRLAKSSDIDERSVASILYSVLGSLQFGNIQELNNLTSRFSELTIHSIQYQKWIDES